MARTTIDPVLRAAAPFADCSTRELRRIAPLVKSIDVPTGCVLMRQGDEGHEVMVVAAGNALVSKDDRVIAEIGPGEVIGEIAMLVQAPRTATVVAASPMTLAVIREEELSSALDASPTVAASVLRAAIRHLTTNAA
jgi:CRP/FNR family transcriptional regulator